MKLTVVIAAILLVLFATSLLAQDRKNSPNDLKNSRHNEKNINSYKKDNRHDRHTVASDHQKLHRGNTNSSGTTKGIGTGVSTNSKTVLKNGVPYDPNGNSKPVGTISKPMVRGGHAGGGRKR